LSSKSVGLTQETGPEWSTITYQFAVRKSVDGGKLGGAVGPKAAVEQPMVKYVWYDGSKDGKQNAPYDLLLQATEETRKTEAGRLPTPAEARRKHLQPSVTRNAGT